MSKLKLLYFEGCPNAEGIRKILVNSGHEFEEIRQDDLSSQDPLKQYSSPTLLKGNDLIFGTPTGAAGGCSLQIPLAKELLAKIEKSRLDSPTKGTNLVTSSGSLGSILTVILCPVCKPAIALLLSSLGLGFVIQEAALQKILIVFLSLMILGLLWSYWKIHKNFAPVLVGFLMAVGLYISRYMYFGDAINTVLMYGSIGGLVAVSIWNLFLKRPVSCETCVVANRERRSKL
ncbi:MAG: MerC family mercury resistance protein [Bacteriovoracia bacterium]